MKKEKLQPIFFDVIARRLVLYTTTTNRTEFVAEVPNFSGFSQVNEADAVSFFRDGILLKRIEFTEKDKHNRVIYLLKENQS